MASRKKPAKKKAAEKTIAGKKKATTKSAAKTGSFQQLIANQPPETRAVARRLRKIVREILPKAEESISLGARLALYKETADICGIQANTDRCHFYLAQGARMADKDGLLEGTGKGTRHVKCYPGDEIPVAAIKRLIREGRKLAKG